MKISDSVRICTGSKSYTVGCLDDDIFYAPVTPESISGLVDALRKRDVVVDRVSPLSERDENGDYDYQGHWFRTMDKSHHPQARVHLVNYNQSRTPEQDGGQGYLEVGLDLNIEFSGNDGNEGVRIVKDISEVVRKYYTQRE